jgi:hypothetical protein
MQGHALFMLPSSPPVNFTLTDCSIVHCVPTESIMDADSMHFDVCGIRFHQVNISHNSPSRDAAGYSCMQPSEVSASFLHLELNSGRSLICHRVSSDRSVFEKCNFVGNDLKGPLFVMSTNTEIKDSFFVRNSAGIIGKAPGRPIYVRIVDSFCDNWGNVPDFVNIIGERAFGKHDSLNAATRNQRDNCVYGSNVSISSGGRGLLVYLFVAIVIVATAFCCGDWLGLGTRRRRLYAGARQIGDQRFDEDGSIQPSVDSSAL